MMEAKFYEPKFKDGKILAFADVDLVEGVTVRGFRVVNGDNGIFAAVPSRPVMVEGETRYFNQVVFAEASKRDEILDKLLEAYARWAKDGVSTKLGEPTAAKQRE